MADAGAISHLANGWEGGGGMGERGAGEAVRQGSVLWSREEKTPFGLGKALL